MTDGASVLDVLLPPAPGYAPRWLRRNVASVVIGGGGGGRFFFLVDATLPLLLPVPFMGADFTELWDASDNVFRWDFAFTPEEVVLDLRCPAVPTDEGDARLTLAPPAAGPSKPVVEGTSEFAAALLVALLEFQL